MTKIEKIPPNLSLSKAAANLLLLFIAFSFSLNFQRIVHLLTTNNSNGIERGTNFSPESNYLLVVSVIVSALVIYKILSFLAEKKTFLFRVAIITILSTSFLIGVIAPSFARYENNIDTFHNGEQLAPAAAFEKGLKPYKNIFVLRGAGEDVITPWLSQKIFGQSIGSYYLLTALLQLFSLVLFFALLSLLFKSNLYFLLVSLWFTLSNYGAFFAIRDIAVWLFLLIAFYIIFKQKYQRILLGILSFIAMVSLFYSFDRGLFLIFLLLILLALQLLFTTKGTFYAMDLSRNHILKKLAVFVPVIIGMTTGVVAALLFIGKDSLAFFISTNIEISKFQGLIFNYPYPDLTTQTFFDWLPIVTLVASSLILVQNYIRNKESIKHLSPTFVFSAIVLLFALIFFRGATGRPDSGHVAYGSTLVFVSFFYIFFEHIKIQRNELQHNRSLNTDYLLISVVTFGLLLLPATINYSRLALMNQTSLHSTKVVIDGPGKPDKFWYTPQVNEVTDAIKRESSPNDYFFVFSSDPIYYYTTGLKNPTRFFISWFADPTPLEQEMLMSLKKNPPKIVLYESGTYYDRPEFISMKERLPLVNEWLLTNYHTKTQIGDAIILTRN